jgi:hypothetical protein
VGIANYTWTITGGSEPVMLEGVRVFHSFTVPGSYLATLVVTDDAGNLGSDVAYIMVHVEGEPDQPHERRSDPGMVVVAFTTILLLGLYKRRLLRAR